MITNVSLCTLYVTDQDAAKAFYVEKLGFVERTDVSLGDGFRWVTVGHPSQPELEVTLMTPGPPLDEEMTDAVRHALDKGKMGGLGSAPTTATRPTRNCRPRVSSSFSPRRTARTESRPSCATTRGTGWSWSSPASIRRPTSRPEPRTRSPFLVLC
jgi:hypothetical protein